MRRGRAVVVVVAVTAVLTSCTPADDGPLLGPRVEAGDVEACVPSGTNRQVYFGEPLTNSGDEPVEITGVTGSGDDLSSVTYFIDVEGPARGELMGGFVWPASEPLGPEESVLARMVEPAGAVIESNETAALIAEVVPDSMASDAAVTETVVRYRSGGRDYTEKVLVQYRVHAGDAC